MAQVSKYPKYLYHKEYDEPKMVENKAQETEFKNLGWVARYLWREYPKYVNGIIVGSKAEEALLLNANSAKPKVVIERGDDRRPVVTEPPMKGSVQVPEDLTNSFEMLAPDGTPIPDLKYDSWKEAQAAQRDLNTNVPGHKARKIEV